MLLKAARFLTVVESQGTVEARQRVTLIPQMAGELTWVSDKFVNGGIFTEGEIILEVDPRDYQLAVISAEAVVCRCHSAVGNGASAIRAGDF